MSFAAQDLPDFLSNIRSSCQSLRTEPDIYHPEENKELTAECAKMAAIHAEAVEIFRKKGTAEYDVASLSFANHYWPKRLSYHQSREQAPDTDEIAKLRDQINEAQVALMNFCGYELAQPAANAANAIFSDVAGENARLRPTVEALIGTYYTQENRQLIQQAFDQARRDIQSFLPRLVSDPATREKIGNDYDKLGFSWIKEPPAAAYTPDAKGVPQLPLKREIDLDNIQSKTSRAIFNDPTLSYFSTLNADYQPQMREGQTVAAERVEILPRLTFLPKDNPAAFLAVVAHECGHKIDPAESELNGYGISSAYDKVLACFSSPKSIQISPMKEGETIADFISAEVLAREIDRLPQEMRRNMLVQSMKEFCVFADIVNTSSFQQQEDPHPEIESRVSGIYGANPDIRSALGCAGEPDHYRTCGLNGPAASGGRQ